MSGVLVIRDDLAGINYPYQLEVDLTPIEGMGMPASMCFGSEKIVVRGVTKEALEQFAEEEGLKSHPRLMSFTITGPAGEVLSVNK